MSSPSHHKLTKSEKSELQRERVNKRYEKKTIEPKNEVIAALSHGLGYEGMTDILLMCDESPCGKDEFYEAQSVMIPKIVQAAKDSCEKAFNQMDSGGFSHDAQWSARRFAEHCVVEFMNTKTHQIIGYSIASHNSKVTDFEIPPETPSNRFEDLASKWLWEQMKSKGQTNKLTYRIHDRDTNSFFIFLDDINDSILQDFDDPNHSEKAFEEMLENIEKKHPLGPLKQSLQDRFAALTNQHDLTYEERHSQWDQTPDEIIKHAKDDCPLVHGWKQFTKEEMMSSLKNALSLTSDFLEKCSHGSTNPNESFHSLKARIAPKGNSYGVSFKARTAIAVLMWNEPLEWYQILCKYCEIPVISKEHSLRLQERLNAKRRHNDKEDTLPQRIKRDKHRKEKRSIKPDPEGHNEAHNPKLSRPKDVHDVHRNKGVHIFGVFPRLDNSDYAASAIQMLYNTEFQDIMGSLQSHLDIPIFQYLDQIFDKLHSEQKVEGEPFRMLISLTGNTEEQRIHPGIFCSQLLSKLHQVLASDYVFSQNRNFLENLFRFQVETSIHCSHCHHTEIDKTYEFVIELPSFPHTTTINDLLKVYYAPSPFTCPQCGNEAEIKKRIAHFPLHPIFQLDKFDDEGYLKDGVVTKHTHLLTTASL